MAIDIASLLPNFQVNTAPTAPGTQYQGDPLDLTNPDATNAANSQTAEGIGFGVLAPQYLNADLLSGYQQAYQQALAGADPNQNMPNSPITYGEYAQGQVQQKMISQGMSPEAAKQATSELNQATNGTFSATGDLNAAFMARYGAGGTYDQEQKAKASNGGVTTVGQNNLPSPLWDAGTAPTGTAGGSGSSGGGGGGSGSNTGTQSQQLQDLLKQLQNSQTSGGALVNNGSNGSNSNNPSVYAPSPASYTSAMNAELGALDSGMQNVNNAIGSGLTQNNNLINANTADLTNYGTAGANAINQGTNQGTTALQQNLQGAVDKYNPVTDQTANDVNFYRNGVTNGFNQDFADYQKSAAYQFPLQEGLAAARNTLGVNGMAESSKAFKDLTKYASDYGATKYMDYNNQRVNQAQGLAQTSLGALQNQTGLQQNLGTSLANLYGSQSQAAGQQYSNTGQNLATARSAGMGYNTALNTSLAEAMGQYSSARADALNRGIIGRGTKSIEINV